MHSYAGAAAITWSTSMVMIYAPIIRVSGMFSRCIRGDAGCNGAGVQCLG